MQGDFIAVAIRQGGQTSAALWTPSGVILHREENGVQRHDRLTRERADRERLARDVRWSDPAYNPSRGCEF